MNSTRLLISEKPMMVLPSLAITIGLEESIVLQQIHYWLNTHEESENDRCFKHGVYWVYNTVEEWQKKQFRWWSIDTVRRVLRSLEKMRLIVSQKFERHKWNQRKWYTVNYAAVQKLEQIKGETWQMKRAERELHVSLFVQVESTAFAAQIGSNDLNLHLGKLPKSGSANCAIDITESTSDTLLYSSTVSEDDRSANLAVTGGERNGNPPTAHTPQEPRHSIAILPQVEVVTTTTKQSNQLNQETAKRHEVRRLKNVLQTAGLPRNIQGYVKQCTLEQLTYAIEATIDAATSRHGEDLVRYTVGIFKNVLDPNPAARQSKQKPLTSKQLERLAKEHYRNKDRYYDDPKLDRSKLYPAIRIRGKDGSAIECVLCGYQNDREWGLETISYHTYREWEGRVLLDSGYRSDSVQDVEIFRSNHPTGLAIDAI